MSWRKFLTTMWRLRIIFGVDISWKIVADRTYVEICYGTQWSYVCDQRLIFIVFCFLSSNWLPRQMVALVFSVSQSSKSSSRFLKTLEHQLYLQSHHSAGLISRAQPQKRRQQALRMRKQHNTEFVSTGLKRFLCLFWLYKSCVWWLRFH